MVSSPEPDPMAVDCPRCDASVVGKPVGYTVFSDDREGPPERWTLLACPKFHAILVLQEAYGGGMGFEDDTPLRVYPPQDRALSSEIPKELRDAHDEARRVFTAKAYKATVAMCGRTLEGVCEKQGVTEKTLQKSLAEMKTQGLIDQRLWDWAELLRDVRNSGAHFNDEEVTRQDAEDCLTFNEALLDYLYVLKKRFDDMQLRRVL
jgi:hypothetical protein